MQADCRPHFNLNCPDYLPLFQSANGNPPNSQNLQDLNVPATEVPLLASKDTVYEVFGDTVTERPTVYYNICQV